jgi:hypothetical protein
MSEQPTTEIRAYAIRKPTALEEVGHVIRDIPGEIAGLWHDSHYRSPWLRRWEEGNCADEGARPLFYADDTETLNSFADYKVWRALGYVTDALLLILVLTLVLTVALVVI